MIDITEWCTAHLQRTKVHDREIEAECPWCGKFGAFNVNRKTGAFRCYKCADKERSYGKSLAPLLVQVTACSWSDALRQIREGGDLSRWTGDGDALIELPKHVAATRLRQAEKEHRVWHPLPPSEAVFEDSREPQWRFPKYLKARGISREVAKRFELRTCHEGIYAGRLIMPMRSIFGRSFTARSMVGHELRYKNPGGAGHRFLIYGLELVRPGADLLIVEGPFDVLRQAGYGANVVGLLGKEMSTEQEFLLKQLPRETVVTLLLDPEEPRAQYKIAKRLADYFEVVRIAKLPLETDEHGDPIDPGSCSLEQATEAVSSARLWEGRRTAAAEFVQWVRGSTLAREVAHW